MSDTMMLQVRSLRDKEWTEFVGARCAFCGDFGRVHLKPKLPVPTVVKCSKCGQWFHRGCLMDHLCPGSSAAVVDRQEAVNEKISVRQRVIENPLCYEFLEWVKSQGGWQTWFDLDRFKLCLACIFEGKWSLDKAKQFAKGENH